MNDLRETSHENNDKCAYKPVIGTKDRKTDDKKTRKRRIAGGLACGFINGFFGGGGGMVLVPTLEKACGLEEKKAHATAIAVIFPISVLSGTVLSTGYGVDWRVLLPVAIGGTSGGVIGAFLIKILPRKIVCFVFVALMAAAGARLAFF